MKTIVLKYCTLLFDPPWGCTVFFDDGSRCDARPHDTHHYHVIAHRCGYGDDVLAYCCEHEFAHAFIEERLFDRPSPVLLALAHGHVFPVGAAVAVGVALYEEATAQMFQRWLRANERPILAGVDWDGLKRDALTLLDVA